MINIFFITIIIFILLQQAYDTWSIDTLDNTNVSETKKQIKTVQFNDEEQIIRKVTRANISEIDTPEGHNKPWSRVLYNPNDEYPYYYYIKVKIPSLNDYESWRNIVPNINFDPRTGELIIPSKDEASALALANLIVINFMGQLSLDNILDKNLIQISVTKARSHEIVKNKLREQIIENLYGSKFNNQSVDLEKDLVHNNQPKTIVHNNQINEIEAYTGSDYAYL